jgi:hypothetical protein
MTIHRNTAAGQTSVTFSLSDDAHDGPVSVVGSFNDWQPGAHQLEPEANGNRSITVVLSDDSDIYFRYLGSNGVWFDDLDADQITPDGSVLRIAATDADAIGDRLADLDTEERQYDDEELREEANTTDRIIDALANTGQSATPADR